MPSRIRIGPEGGPYVIVDENNGILDITTPNDEVDFGNNDLINAALGGILDAKGNDITNVDALNSNSVNTESASIAENDGLSVAGFTSQQHDNLLASIEASGSGISETVSDISRDGGKVIHIQIIRYRDDMNDDDSTLTMTFDDDDDTFRYLMRDEAGNNRHQDTGVGEIELINTTAANNADMHGGYWRIVLDTGGRCVVVGDGYDMFRHEGEHLQSGKKSGGINSSFDIILESDSEDAELVALIWESNGGALR